MLNRFHGGDTIADARWRDGFEPWPEGRDRAEAGMAGRREECQLAALTPWTLMWTQMLYRRPGPRGTFVTRSPRLLAAVRPGFVHPAGCLIYHGRQCPRPKFDKRGKRHPGLGMLRSARERARQKAGFTVKVQQEDGS